MGRIWDVWAATLAVAICMTWTTLAYGQEPVAEEAYAKSVVVIIDSGTADLLLESTVRATTETKLVSEGYVIVQDVQVAGDRPVRLLACSGQLACITEVLSGIPSEYVVFVSMRSDKQEERVSYKIVARTFEVGTGRVIARIMARCDACKDELDLAPFAEEVIDKLLSDEKPANQPVAVPITTVEPVTENTQESTQTGTLEVVGDVSTNRPRQKRSVLPYIAIGGGISALGTGVALLLLDGPVIDNGVRRPDERATSAGGYMLMGTGGALLGLGVWMLLSEPDDGTTSDSPIVVAPSSTGANVVEGEFLMQSFSPVMKLCLALVCGLYLGCTRADALYCEVSSDCTDPARSFCDLGGAFSASQGVAKTCIADPNNSPVIDGGLNVPDAMIPDAMIPDATVACTSSANCSASLPICTANMCEACVFGSVGDSACVDRDSSTPFCSANGDCRECIMDSTCGVNTPVCNPEGVCDRCSEHDECASGACTDSGACVLASAIVYVSTTGANSANCGTSPGNACRDLAGPEGAIAKAGGSKTHIVMATGTYTQTLAPSFIDLSVEVVGHNAVLVAPSIPGPALAVSAGADVVLSDLTINGGSGLGGSGINCSGSDLRLVRTTVAGSAESGIEATVSNVRLEDTLVQTHSEEGMLISGGTLTVLDSTIENNGKRGARIADAVVQVERSRFYSNNLGGIFIENSSFNLESTEVVNNGNKKWTRLVGQ